VPHCVDYIARALWEARRLAPRAKLLINVFGLEYDLRVEHDRRYHFLKLLERLKRAAVPLDGVGLQAHLDLSKAVMPADVPRRFLKEIAGLDDVKNLSQIWAVAPALVKLALRDVQQGQTDKEPPWKRIAKGPGLAT
jgi:hypothetical protein